MYNASGPLHSNFYSWVNFCTEFLYRKVAKKFLSFGVVAPSPPLKGHEYFSFKVHIEVRIHRYFKYGQPKMYISGIFQWSEITKQHTTRSYTKRCIMLHSNLHFEPVPALLSTSLNRVAMPNDQSGSSKLVVKVMRWRWTPSKNTPKKSPSKTTLTYMKNS